MAQIQKMQCETELKCSADKFYTTFKNNLINLPQLMPETYKSIQVLEGDGQNLGTVRLWKYVMGGNVLMVKEKVIAMDDKKRSMVLDTIGGGFLAFYSFMQTKIDVTPITNQGATADGCVVKWTLEFQKANEDVPAPDMYLDLADKVTKQMASQIP